MTDQSTKSRVGRTTLAGVPLDRCDLNDAVGEVLDGRLANGGIVVTPNVSITRQLAVSPINALLNRADLWLVDGWPVAALLRMRGDGVFPRTTGSDLLPKLAVEAVKRGRSVVILGAGAKDAARALRTRTGSTAIRGAELPYAPAGSPELVTAATKEITDSDTIVFICLGFPKQELLAIALQEEFPEAVLVGVGAAALMLTGALPRAPRLIQRIGMEWAWRVTQDPRRLAHRYLVQDLPWLCKQICSTLVQRILVRGSAH